ncbi:MAG: CvpA family protein [Bacteroidaceae bacterium]|nr:CvpA family protein [Bacteroidaceae bacterium]
MEVIDIIMLGLVVLMTIWGMVRGIVRQVGDVAALLLGVICTYIWSKDITALLFERTGWSLLVCEMVSYAGLFFVIYTAIRIVSGFLKSITRLVRLGWIDSIAGGLFGAFKTILFVSLALNLAMLVTKDAKVWKSPTLTKAICYETVRDFAPKVLNFVEGKTTTPTP